MLLESLTRGQGKTKGTAAGYAAKRARFHLEFREHRKPRQKAGRTARISSEFQYLTLQTRVGAVAAGYLGYSAAGNLAAAASQFAGSVTGQTKLGEEGADVASTLTSALGFGEFVLAKGDLNKAANAAAIEGLVASDPKELLRGGTVERAVHANEYRENVKQLLPSAWPAPIFRIQIILS